MFIPSLYQALAELCRLNSLIIVFEAIKKKRKSNFPISESVCVTGLAMRINRLISVTQAVSASLNVCPQAPTNCCLTHYFIKKEKKGEEQGKGIHHAYCSSLSLPPRGGNKAGVYPAGCQNSIFPPNGLNTRSAALLE